MGKGLKLTGVILVTLFIITPFAVAVPVNDGSAAFLRKFGDSDGRIDHISLSIVALSEANGKVRDDLTPRIREFTRELLSYQNPDGGWGYFPGSVSNIMDTAYALIALKRALPFFEGTADYFKVEEARERGIAFLTSSATADGWGYVPETVPMFYPTVLSLWALGENGLRNYSSIIGRLGDLPKHIDGESALALKLIAMHALNVTPSKEEMEELVSDLKSPNLSVEQRAILTYALTLYSQPTFEVVAQFAKLDEMKHVGGSMVFWADTPKYPISITDTVTPTAYALLAVSRLVPPIHRRNINTAPCSEIISAQNPDGGWGIFRGGPSNEKATYYALLAVESCYPAPAVVERGVNWTKSRLPMDEKEAISTGRLTVAYYYALKTLLHFNALSRDEVEHAVSVVRSLELERGRWGVKGLGPQPAETAMAVDLLLSLGVPKTDPDVQAAKDWLLSISSTGWGLYAEGKLYGYMLDMNVLDTLTVLWALKPIASGSQLEPHISWLIDQRVDGGWPYMREYKGMDDKVHVGKPRLDLTVSATLLLLDFGKDYTDETLSLVQKMLPEVVNDTIELSSAVIYLQKLRRMPSADLSDVRAAMESRFFTVAYGAGKLDDATAILNYLRRDFGFHFDVQPLGNLTSGNYVVLAGFTEVNVSRYNRYITVGLRGVSVRVNNSTYPAGSTVLLIPGRTSRGFVLFVLYSGASDVARLIFKIGYVKYMQGKAVAVTFTDLNGDGKVQLDEVRARTIG
ncbi:prenyltransferase/squalene oxidase repeat-containing protein [Thermococcus sp.]|uniref:prenyltransferase/squalene oxidase repeat-containing protein n=1 Tax=Thermococcus sp. TaxID=35749 RepID=UPI002623E228|nr:prenyltransferase/squalene oxidase repeat-containing protein [Thermococcus sp.]